MRAGDARSGNRSAAALLVLAAALLASSGCAALQSALGAAPKPTASLKSVGFEGVSLTTVSLHFDIEVTNPYDVPLPLVNLDYALSSGEARLLKGVASIQGTIPPKQAKQVSLPVDVSIADVLGFAQGVRAGSTVPYVADVKLGVDAPALGRISVPMGRKGDIKLPSIPGSNPANHDESVHKEDDVKTLFVFDDHSIPFRSNLDLTPVPGVKYSGNPVLKRGAPGSPDARWARLWAGSVIHEQGKFRMWYSGAGSIEEWMKLQFSMLYAESADGLTWTKPNLGLASYRGSRENNLVDIEYPVEMPAVIRDDGPDVPEDERYKMFTENLHGPEPEPFIAVSADGLHWRTIAHPQHRGVSLYRFQGRYHSAFVMYTPELPGGFPGGRVMGVVRTTDFRTWSGPPCLGFHRANYHANPPEITEQVHTPAGFWNRGNVVVGVYGQIHQVEARPGTKFARLGSGMEDTREDLGLFLSNDGLHFREPIPGFRIVSRGMEGQWDGGSVVPANAFVNVGEHTYLYYGAWDNGMCFDTAAGDVGLASWRRDGLGFVRIRDVSRPAVMQTEAIPPAAAERKVYANFDVDCFRPGCSLVFELVDAAGRVLPGYSAAECVGCAEPGLAQPVRWRDHGGIGGDIREAVELRVIFKTNGDMTPYQSQCSSPMLYCLYIADGGETL